MISPRLTKNTIPFLNLFTRPLTNNTSFKTVFTQDLNLNWDWHSFLILRSREIFLATIDKNEISPVILIYSSIHLRKCEYLLRDFTRFQNAKETWFSRDLNWESKQFSKVGSHLTKIVPNLVKEWYLTSSSAWETVAIYENLMWSSN